MDPHGIAVPVVSPNSPCIHALHGPDASPCCWGTMFAAATTTPADGAVGCMCVRLFPKKNVCKTVGCMPFFYIGRKIVLLSFSSSGSTIIFGDLI
jgi:hypothetical protein